MVPNGGDPNGGDPNGGDPNGGDPHGGSAGCPVASTDLRPNVVASSSCPAVVADCPGANGTEGDGRFDITSIVRECASLLTVEEPFVCNTDSFSLHDSMAATELTDRTMDCCEIPASYYTGKESGEAGGSKFVFPRPPPQGLDDPFAMLPWERLSPRGVSFVAMKMLGCLQAVLAGSSVGESTFTCLYAHSSVLRDMHRRLFGESAAGIDPVASATQVLVNNSHPSFPLQFALFVSAVALVDATDLVRTVVVNADIYEEEDFSPNTYDIPFYSEAVDIPTLRWIEEVRRLLAESPSQAENPNACKLIDGILEFFQCFISVGSSLVRALLVPASRCHLGELNRSPLLVTIEQAYSCGFAN
jgi:Mak10 subunit, NatC N(alpha)-terminal acetyltransferase